MNKINVGFLFPLVALVILIYSLSTQLFSVPPLGKLLNPFTGVVQNDHEPQLEALTLHINQSGLRDSVRVYLDDRKVPHIYASNTNDLYFTQGYVSASLRLWQMDFISYVAAGRLSEIFDKDEYFDYDRNQRRIGILESAKSALKLIEKDPVTNQILTAYSNGVNAYIHSLDYSTMPLEYKLLDYKPESWSKLKSVLILKTLGNTLSGYEEDMFMSKMMMALGEDNFNKLFPDFDTHITPVMNTAVTLSAAAIPVKKPGYLDYSFITFNTVVTKSTYNPKLGSNSWVVSGKKTKSGFPILASDPHLGLNLPCFWVEMQLTSPEVNVYGASIPGTPSIIIGFNKNIAWGITNGADDVKDWYKLKITDDYKKYELDGKWVDLKYRLEKIVRRGHQVFYDTVYTSVHGPIVSTSSFAGRQPEMKNFALKWTLHEPSNEFLSFIKLNKAADYKGYKDAIRHFSCPVLNFTFACKDNTIAVNHQGAMPVKRPGQGKFIMDGTQSSQIYTKLVPEDSLPKLVNPACNYVLSANQHPTYPGYQYYYNGYYSENRANRIQQLLEGEKVIDISKMQQMQLDNINSFAVEALPVLLKQVDLQRLSAAQRKELIKISKWQGTYGMKDESAVVFEHWLRNIRTYTWDELSLYNYAMRSPSDDVLIELIRKNPGDLYFDKVETTAKENAGDIVTEAFKTALAEFDGLKKEGPAAWGDLNKVNVTHMTEIAAFSVRDLSSAGSPNGINAISANWGPSWRMVVELGERPKAYGIYPGGQSGNIGSKYYTNFIEDWRQGKYYRLQFFLSEKEAKSNAVNTWIIK